MREICDHDVYDSGPQVCCQRVWVSIYMGIYGRQFEWRRIAWVLDEDRPHSAIISRHIWSVLNLNVVVLGNGSYVDNYQGCQVVDDKELEIL